MRKIIVSLFVVFAFFTTAYLFYDFEIKKSEKENSKTFLDLKDFEAKNKYFKSLSPKDLDAKSFIKLFTERYKKDSTFNFVTMSGDFPDNWVKPNEVSYLVSIMRSKKKCCGYMNVFSSSLLNDNGEVGGFAIIFLNSYISKTKINLGSNSNPKTDEESARKIESWYQNNLK